ncbi:hypothetical protein STCU_10117 [Strigomonas culicis]|uniref:Uncharacterized protein n=1 Tax=Strigomonas culicis TaxID=28005 RepID=S9TP58_9TRYP|nr:hypothetical protein STCU_10117 [Strigomonas culicis]|eukprot:EPY18208.1 hypothetical protein STCU_10117 [Strigomonas culicis]
MSLNAAALEYTPSFFRASKAKTIFTLPPTADAAACQTGPASTRIALLSQDTYTFGLSVLTWNVDLLLLLTAKVDCPLRAANRRPSRCMSGVVWTSSTGSTNGA